MYGWLKFQSTVFPYTVNFCWERIVLTLTNLLVNLSKFCSSGCLCARLNFQFVVVKKFPNPKNFLCQNHTITLLILEQFLTLYYTYEAASDCHKYKHFQQMNIIFLVK